MRLIDADALVNETWFVSFEGDDINSIGKQILNQCKDIVRDAPTIEPKKGKWIRNPLSDWMNCSECGETTLLDNYNFCPHCGARMEEEE